MLDFLLLIIAQLFVNLIAFLPFAIAQRIAKFIIRLLIACIPRFRHAAQRNLEVAFPSITPDERDKIFQKSLAVLANNFVWYCKLPRLSNRDYENRVDLAGHVRPLAPSRDVGILYVAMHFGCFELGVQGHVARIKPVNILARGFGFERLDNWWNARRENNGSKVFARKGGYRYAQDSLRKGEDVVMLIDQNVKRNHAVFVPFFGVQAATTKTAALATLRTGAPLVVVASIELADGKCRVEYHDIDVESERSQDLDSAIVNITTKIHQVFESLIRKHPEQWFWIHRRFKTRPEGEAETFYD